MRLTPKGNRIVVLTFEDRHNSHLPFEMDKGGSHPVLLGLIK